MQKVYLLLRNNRKSGPYSLEELVQMGLKPFDLIWVEGKSFGWSYPAEIEQLKPYVPQQTEVTKASDTETKRSFSIENDTPFFAKTKEAKKVFVSLPGNTSKKIEASKESSDTDILERKAEELRKRAYAYAAEKRVESSEPAIEVKYSRTLTDVENDFTSWIYTQKTAKKKSYFPRYTKQVIIVMLPVLVAVFFFFDRFYNNEPSSSLATKISESKPSQSKLATPIMEPDSNLEQPTTETETTLPPSFQQETMEESENSQVVKKKETISTPRSQTKISSPLPSTSNKQKVESIKEDHNVVAGIESQERPQPEQIEKKKTLGQKIDGFFDKFKAKKEERKAESTTDREGERNAARREDLPKTVDLVEFVKVTTNERSNEWMMGIQGLRLSLRNNSNTSIKTASVEVCYYNDQNDLLEKKLVYFSNVPPKKAVTIAAPDHRVADHVDFKVLSAEGIPDGKQNDG